MSTSDKVALTTDGNTYRNCLKGYGYRAVKNREPFIEWLKTLPAATEFGRGIDECPLARFSGYTVGYCTYGGGDGHLPGWAQRFVLKYIPPDRPAKLTIDRALSILRRVK